MYNNIVQTSFLQILHFLIRCVEKLDHKSNFHVVLATNEINTDERPKDPCTEARNECQTIQCQYGKEEFIDDNDCERCRCADPCRNRQCPDGTTCSISYETKKSGYDFRTECRESNNHSFKLCFLKLYL